MRDMLETGDVGPEAPAAADENAGLSWASIIRLGLVQTALGAIVVLTTSVLNRVMVNELLLLPIIPGALITVHYAMQALRPTWGHASDSGRRRTPWIVGGMAVLAMGGTGAALATAAMAQDVAFGVAAAATAFVAIGVGVGAAGTSLLALLASEVAPRRRGAAASIVWSMMIVGFVVSAILARVYLEPFTLERMTWFCGAVSVGAFVLACVAIWGVEPKPGFGRAARVGKSAGPATAPFREAVSEVWRDETARRFTIFVFVSMFAYQCQDPILEPYAGFAFGFTVAQSAGLSGAHHAGVLFGMISVALATTHAARFGLRLAAAGSLGFWVVIGCALSGVCALALAAAGLLGASWAATPVVAALGFSNGAFAVAAIGAMMALAGQGRRAKEGVRMGVWGAAQAFGFGVAGLVASAAATALVWALGAATPGYSWVFVGQALLFVWAAALARGIATPTGAAVATLATDADAAELSLRRAADARA